MSSTPHCHLLTHTQGTWAHWVLPMIIACYSQTAGRTSRKDCAAVILYAAENATRAALDAIQILAGNGCAPQSVTTLR